MNLFLTISYSIILSSSNFLEVESHYDILYKRDCTNGKVLEGRVYKSFNSFPNPNPAECFSRCTQDCRCESFQFKHSLNTDSVCELNEFEVNSSKTLVKKEGFVFCEFNFAPKHSEDCSCEVDCCNKDVNPCKNGGKCIANCGSRPRYYCVCADGRIGPDCQLKPKSCLEILKKNPSAKSGYYDIYMSNNKHFRTQVYCDMISYSNEAWTLVQSFTFANQQLFHYPFYSNIEYHERWSKYRLSKLWMKSIRSNSSKWRATCDLLKPLASRDKVDYVVTKFSNVDILSNNTFPGCYTVDYININNFQCRDCSTWFSQKPNENPHFAPKYGEKKKCTFQGPIDAPANSTVFGNYNEVIKNFRCSNSPSATTEFWFGGEL